MKKLIPLLDRVLIKRHEAITKTRGGIVIPEKAQAKVLRGTVVAVGPGGRNQVIYSKTSPIRDINIFIILERRTR